MSVRIYVSDITRFAKTHSKWVDVCQAYFDLFDKLYDTTIYSGARKLYELQSGGMVLPLVDDPINDAFTYLPAHDKINFNPIDQMLDRAPYIALGIKSQQNYYIRVMAKIVFSAYSVMTDINSRSFVLQDRNLCPVLPLNPAIRNSIQKVHLLLRDGPPNHPYQSSVLKGEGRTDLSDAMLRLRNYLETEVRVPPEGNPETFDNQNYTPTLNMCKDLYNERFSLTTHETEHIYRIMLNLMKLALNQCDDKNQTVDTIGSELQMLHISDSTLAILPQPLVALCKTFQDDDVGEISNQGLLYVDAYSRLLHGGFTL